MISERESFSAEFSNLMTDPLSEFVYAPLPYLGLDA